MRPKQPEVVTLADIGAALREAGERDRAARGGPADRKNYAERLSRGLARIFADLLRPEFPGILPAEDGSGQESPARTAHGFKRLDINYSTPELGLGLGVSIETVDFPDPRSGRYTKNFTRIDNELRAEALDYHHRQPYAVLVATVFLLADACDDARAAGGDALSSFAQARRIFLRRSGRERPTDALELFEGLFLVLYDTAPGSFGRITAIEVATRIPRRGRPRREVLDLPGVVARIVDIYDRRNNPRTSATEATPGNRRASTARAGRQFSHRSSAPCPAAASPSSNPPMPAKRPATRRRMPAVSSRNETSDMNPPADAPRR